MFFVVVVQKDHAITLNIGFSHYVFNLPILLFVSDKLSYSTLCVSTQPLADFLLLLLLLVFITIRSKLYSTTKVIKIKEKIEA